MAEKKKELYATDPAKLSPFAARLAERRVLKWVVALTAALGALLEVIDTSIVNVALPDIQGNLGATLAEAGWVSTGYSCANVVVIPLGAWLGARFGRKNYFVFSLVGFTATSFLCGLAPNLSVLILGRVLQGLAGGGLLAKAQSIIFDSFPPEEEGMAQALFVIGVIAGPAIGPVLGGWLTDNIGWRWIFFVNLPVGILASAAALTFLPRDDEGEIQRDSVVDWWGITLLALGLGCFQTMLEEGQREDWFASRFIVLTAVGAAVGVALFVWRELATDHPAVDLRVLRHGSVAAGSAYSTVLGMGIYGVTFAVPVFVQNQLHYTPTQSGVLQVPGAVAAAVGTIALGPLMGKVDARLLVAAGAVITVGSAVPLVGINPNTGWDSLFWPLIGRNVGTVMMFLPLSLATLGGVPAPELEAASGFFNLTRQLGSSLGIAAVTTLSDRLTSSNHAKLVEKLTLTRPETVGRVNLLAGAFAGRHGDPVGSHRSAFHALDQTVTQQATLLAYGTIFYYAGLAFLVSMPLILLLRKGDDVDPGVGAG